MANIGTSFEFPYQITDKPITPDLTPEELNVMKQMHTLAASESQNRTEAVTQIEQAIEKYPHLPELKNYLQVSYALNGQEDKAFATGQQTIKQHPEYMFAKINLAELYLIKKDMEQVDKILPQPKELSDYYPDKTKLFHITEVVNFEKFAITYYIDKGDLKTSEKRIDRLDQLAIQYPQCKQEVENLQRSFIMRRGLLNLKEMKSSQENTPTVAAVAKEFYPPSEEAPQFTHNVINQLYKFNFDLPEKTIQEILALPQDSLIADLHKVLADCQSRFKVLKGKEISYYAHVHAIFLLGSLKAKGSLNEILNLTRQDKEFYDFYFFGHSDQFLTWALYHLAQDQLSVLKEYMFESDNYCWFRNAIANIPAHVALLQPERRTEVLEWYQEVMQYLIDNREDKTVLDGNVMADLIKNLLDIEAVELKDVTEEAYRHNLVAVYIIGSFDQVLEELENPVKSDVLLADLDMSAMYKRLATNASIYNTIKKAGYEKFINKKNEKFEDFENLIGKSLFNNNDNDAKIKTVPLPEKKYGRNDKVTAVYDNGERKENVKFKKVEADYKKGLCQIVS